MFWFTKNRTIELHCYTDNKSLNELFPIVKSSKAIPKWFKNAKAYAKTTTNVPKANLKACPAVQEYLLKNITVPLWSDINLFNEGGNINYQSAYEPTDKETIQSHGKEQWQDFTQDELVAHLKLLSPWTLKTKESIKFLLTDSFYHNKMFNDIRILPGIIDFSYVRDLNVNMFVNHTLNHRLLSAGTPLVNLVPLTEKPVKVITHVVNKDKKRELENELFSFKFIKNHKLFDKCPFHKEE